MIASIYDVSGKLIKNVSCTGMQPYCGDMVHLTSDDGRDVITSLPVVAMDISGKPAPEFLYPELEQTFDAEIHFFDVNNVIRYKGCMELISCGKIVWFWDGTNWIVTNASVLFDNFSKGKP